jgi:glutaryl-CoA dehydrogenase
MEKIGKFNAEDPFLISEQLTEEERMIADSARAYARENLLPRVTDMFINESDAPEIFTEMGAQGLLGVTIKVKLSAVVNGRALEVVGSGSGRGLVSLGV